MKQRLLSLLAVSAALACNAVHATEVSSLAGATTYEFGSSNYMGGAAQTIAPGITWTSSYGSSVFGYTQGYGFNLNGSWDGQSMIGSNSGSQSDVMTISFAAPVNGVGMLMQYARGDGDAAVVNAYDVDNQLLDTYTLTFTDNATNGGQFVGFRESGNDISYITMAGSYIGGAHLAVSAVPESSNMALLLAGMGLVGVVARRRKQA